MTRMNDLRIRTVGLLVSLVAVACGQTASQTQGAPDGSVDAGDAATAATCTFEPAGAAFTFHVKNSGTRTLYLTFGCGTALPVTVDGAAGPLPISTGSGFTTCDQSCEGIASAAPGSICQDCGGGVSKRLAPGDGVDIVWDRRVYRPSTVGAHCTGSDNTRACIVGNVLRPARYQGTLTVCDNTSDPFLNPIAGECPSKYQVTSRFDLDLATNETTIDAK